MWRTDASSNVTILGDFWGSADFGKGTMTAGPAIDDGFLLRLDSTGKTVFSTQFVNTRSGSSMMASDLAVTPAGVSTIAIFADSDTDFGNGQDSVSLLLGVKSSSDLVQFDTSGKVLFRKTVPSLSSSLEAIDSLATNASGFLWATGSGSSPVSPSVMNLPPLTMGITASGTLAWQQTALDGAFIAAGPKGAVLYNVGTTSEILQAVASDGTSPWTVSTSIAGDERQAGNVIVDANGNLVIGGGFVATVAFGSAPPLTSAGNMDVAYQETRRHSRAPPRPACSS
jgi:hypothetical protein